MQSSFLEAKDSPKPSGFPVKSPVEDEEDEVFFEAELFLNTEYQEHKFEFGAHAVRLLVSSSACTDFDLTGQVLWPAARLLAEYLAAHPRWAVGRRCALELGSGLGLVGCLAAQLCPAVLTDHNEHVLNILRQNAELNTSKHEASCMKLDWTCAGDIKAAQDASPDGAGFDLILGADVCYGQGALPALFTCASQLLARSSSAAFLLSYVSRAQVIDRSLEPEVRRNGLVMEEIAGTRRDVAGGHQGVIYHVHWPAGEAAGRT